MSGSMTVTPFTATLRPTKLRTTTWPLASTLLPISRGRANLSNRLVLIGTGCFASRACLCSSRERHPWRHGCPHRWSLACRCPPQGKRMHGCPCHCGCRCVVLFNKNAFKVHLQVQTLSIPAHMGYAKNWTLEAVVARVQIR